MNNETMILHWIYVATMFLGATVIAFMSKDRKGVPGIEYFLAFFILIWSGIAYMAIAIGQGILNIDNEVIFYARYLDWVVTTPLLLVSLTLVGMYYKENKDKVIILGLVGADVIMVISGLVGDISQGTNRFIWFGIGLVAFFVVLWLIWGPIENIASSQGARLYSLYKKLALYLTIFWIGYPTTWILGPSGLGIISDRLDVYLFIILPIFSKVGFGLLSLIGLRKLEN